MGNRAGSAQHGKGEEAATEEQDNDTTLKSPRRFVKLRRLSHAFRNLLRSKEDMLSREAEPGQVLSPYEQRLLRQTWSALEDDKDLFGQMIFLKVFETEPMLKVLFMWDDIPTELLCQNPAFQKHAVNIVKILESCIKRLDSLPSKVSHPLKRLGRKHTRFQSFGFTPYHWELFQTSMITALTCEFAEDRRKDDIVLAWRKLTSFIIDEMREGYEESAARMPKKQPRKSIVMRSIQEVEHGKIVGRRRSNEDLSANTTSTLSDYLQVAYPRYHRKRHSFAL